MEVWGGRLYGDPCVDCGWSWSADAAECIVYVARTPGHYMQLLARATGAERHPDLTWSVTGYVCYVADNLWLWAERVAGVLGGADTQVGGYDPDALAAARGYGGIALPAALWSLENSAAAWIQVLTAAVEDDVVLRHTIRGQQRATDIAQQRP